MRLKRIFTSLLFVSMLTLTSCGEKKNNSSIDNTPGYVVSKAFVQNTGDTNIKCTETNEYKVTLKEVTSTQMAIKFEVKEEQQPKVSKANEEGEVSSTTSTVAPTPEPVMTPDYILVGSGSGANGKLDWNIKPVQTSFTDIGFTYAEETGLYSLTVDLYKNDKIKVASYGTWDAALGYSNITKGQNLVGDAKDSNNILITKNGNYTLTTDGAKSFEIKYNKDIADIKVDYAYYLKGTQWDEEGKVPGSWSKLIKLEETGLNTNLFTTTIEIKQGTVFGFQQNNVETNKDVGFYGFSSVIFK